MIVIVSPVFVSAVLAGSGHDDKSKSSSGEVSMEHQEQPEGFKHDMTVEGIKAEFQIMRLESMNMTDPGGATHHVMVKFMDAEKGRQLKEVVGRIKIISPSKVETVVDLKDYSGIFAANVAFEAPGKYGIICLAKVGDKKPLYKFWYAHQ